MAIKITDLKKQIRDNAIKPVYLFYGEERYLIDTYLNKITESVPDGGFPDFNKMIVEDAKTSLADISDFTDTYPMMSEKKILILRDSGIFKSPSEDSKSFWTKLLSDVPEYLVIIFVEREIDKRSVIYKAIDKAGDTVEFAMLSQTDAVTWTERRVIDAGKKIKKDTAEYLVELCDEGLSNLKNEIDKLLMFSDEEITRSDIERLVPKSLNVKVFEMTDAIMVHDTDTALAILSDMKTAGEPVFRILSILLGTFDKMLHAQLLLAECETQDVIAKKLKVAPFIAKKYMKKSYSEQELTNCIISIADIDYSIKEGQADEWTALEYFITGLFKK